VCPQHLPNRSETRNVDMTAAPTTPMPPDLVAALRSARSVVALTGAGMSAESGVPTFRDAQTGLWARFDPRELATPSAFARNPQLVWDWYAWRRARVGEARPNAGHRALVVFERQVPDFSVITQNVDGLHAAAGSTSVIELHGNILRVRCSAENTVVSAWEDQPGEVPRCARCGALLRPDIVWFEEALPEAALAEAIARANRAEIVLVIGTSAEVYPAAQLPFDAQAHGATVVEVNPSATPLSAHADHVLRGTAATILPALAAAAWG
jgi:NAD-dependent deacetylase